MNKTLLVLSVALVAILAIGGVFAYQNGNGYNAGGVDKVAAEKAIESGDYAAWKALHINSHGKMASLVNEENFHLLQEMHNAKGSGDYAKVAQIKTELGFTPGFGKGNGAGMHQKAGQGKNAGNCPYTN